MKRKRHTPEEIIKKLREAATLLAGGQGVEEVCKKLEVSPPTCHRWRQEYGGAREETVKRLKELEKENVQLKKLLADLSLEKAMLKELVEGKWQARRANAKRWIIGSSLLINFECRKSANDSIWLVFVVR